MIRLKMSFKTNEIQEDRNKLIKRKCEKNTLFFTRYFFKKNYGKKFIVNKHHELISKALDKVYTGETKKLIINIAPRYGKTELAVKNFIAKGFALNPKAKFLHVSYSQDLAQQNSEEVRDNFILNPEFNKLFPARLKQGSTQKKKWSTEQGGMLYATATGGQVTGFGAGQIEEDGETKEFFDNYEKSKNFGGAIVIDDPIKPEDADQPNSRRKVNERYESTLKNRVNSVNTPIIIIMQRLHENDLCGHLIKTEGDEWEVLTLPCIEEDEEGNERSMWEFKHSLEWLQTERKRNPTVFGRQFQQNPMPAAGILFPKHELNWYKSEDLNKKDADFVMCANDVADEGADDYCMAIAYIFDTNVYIDDVLFNKKGLDINVKSIVEKVHRHEIKEMHIETNGAGKKHLKNVRNEVKTCRIVGKHNSTNKESRILNEEGFVKINFYFRADYEADSEYARYIYELTNYLKEGRNEHDDAADGTALLANVIYQKFKSRFTNGNN